MKMFELVEGMLMNSALSPEFFSSEPLAIRSDLTGTLDAPVERSWLYVLANDVDMSDAVLDHHDRVSVDFWNSTERLRIRIALAEALANAIYHGNLEMLSELREADEAAFQALADLRRQQRPYRDRRVHVQITYTPAAAVYEVRDEGPGFNPRALPDPTAPPQLERSSGRGLLLIRNFMDEVRHNRRGNLIRMVKRLPNVRTVGRAAH